MKVINFRTSKEGYLESYVEVALSPFKLTKTEQLVVARILFYINKELEEKVPIDAALKLVSMLDYRHMIQGDLELSAASMANIFMSLRKKNIIDDNNRLLRKFVLKYSDGGFAYSISIKEEDGI